MNNNEVNNKDIQENVLAKKGKNKLPIYLCILIVLVGLLIVFINKDKWFSKKETNEQSTKAESNINKEKNKEKQTSPQPPREEQPQVPAQNPSPSPAPEPIIETPPAANEMELTPGTALYLYKGEGNSIELNGIGFEYVVSTQMY